VSGVVPARAALFAMHTPGRDVWRSLGHCSVRLLCSTPSSNAANHPTPPHLQQFRHESSLLVRIHGVVVDGGVDVCTRGSYVEVTHCQYLGGGVSEGEGEGGREIGNGEKKG
jgi:hypothetical protein